MPSCWLGVNLEKSAAMPAATVDQVEAGAAAERGMKTNDRSTRLGQIGRC
jgi:hypothetical protein